MPRAVVFGLFFSAVFLQAGAYGLTFMLPKLFSAFHADEKTVGLMLLITTISTLLFVFYAGHLADRFGRVITLGIACFSIAASLFLYGHASAIGMEIILASILLGAGWGLTYSLIPIALTTIVNTTERVRYFSLYSIFMMAGFGLSPVMTAHLENQGYSIADSFYITAIFCGISGLIFLILSRPIQKLAINPNAPKSSLTLKSIKYILTTKAVLPILMVLLGASVFAGMSNFQSVFAEERDLDYSDFFLYYTITVVICRIALAKFTGGTNPYAVIAFLQFIMCASVIVFIISGESQGLYNLVAVLFGIGYGASYPVLVAMTANDADPDYLPQSLQLFAFTYFIGIFGFPVIAGWLIVEVNIPTLLILVAAIAGLEATMAARRALTKST